MIRHVLLGSFAREEEILWAVRSARKSGFRIADVYTPYAVHGMDEAMGLRRSRLPIACFIFGVIGAATAIWFQYWSMSVSWPVNVGGKPWNSLPAWIPVAFELTVLFAGLGVVLAFFICSRMYLGKHPTPLYAGATDDRFVLALENTGTAFDKNAARQLLENANALSVEERER
jgi:hypothetical protein